MSKPPSSNTGAPNTAPLENQVLIDWCGFTLPFDDPWRAVELMGLSRGLFTELERGGMGYKKRLQFNHISVYYDGSDNMGVHVEMTGKGCRDYEAHRQDWRHLFALVKLDKGHLTRLDIAIDTVDGSLTLDQIETAYSAGLFRSFFRQSGLNTKDLLTSDGPVPAGKTRYFGSPTSRTVFRIYDKAAQMGVDGPWIRFELQLRDERAVAAADEIISRGDLGHIATGIINTNLAFINHDDSNKSRCSLMDWWSAWLLHTDKLKLTKVKALKVLSEVQEYMKKQYAPTLAMLKKGLGVSAFYDFMNEIITDGYKRMTRKHDDIITCTRLCTELPF